MRRFNRLLALLTVGILFGCAANKTPYIPPEHMYKHDPPPEPDLPEPSAAELETLADRLFGSGNLPLAYIKYQKALELDPQNIRVNYKLGLTLVAGQRFDDAIKQFQQIETVAADFPFTYEGLGLAYFGKKDFSKAMVNFKKAIVLDKRLWRSYAYMGLLHQHQKEYFKAMTAYQEAIIAKPGDGSLHNNLGVVYYLSGKYSDAVQAFNTAVALNYGNPKLYNNLALALAALERYAEAQQAFEKAGPKAQAHNNMGCIYMQKGLNDQAVDSFEQALEAQPQFYKKAHENLLKAKKARIGMLPHN